MKTTPTLQFPIPLPEQRSADVIHNDTIERLSLLCHSKGLITRNPGAETPVFGESRIVGSPAIGEFEGHEGDYALYLDGWKFTPAVKGLRHRIIDEVLEYNGPAEYNGSLAGWGPQMGETVFVEREHDLPVGAGIQYLAHPVGNDTFMLPYAQMRLVAMTYNFTTALSDAGVGNWQLGLLDAVGTPKASVNVNPGPYGTNPARGVLPGNVLCTGAEGTFYRALAYRYAGTAPTTTGSRVRLGFLFEVLP